jgi:hypothetical protein
MGPRYLSGLKKPFTERSMQFRADTSFPFLALARQRQVPYDSVLGYAEAGWDGVSPAPNKFGLRISDAIAVDKLVDAEIQRRRLFP